MNASLKHRFCAYVIDLLLIIILSTGITSFTSKDDEIIRLENNLSRIDEELLSNDISFSEYFVDVSSNLYLIDFNNKNLIIVEFIIMFIYYQLFVFLMSGRSLGMLLMRIKLVKDDSKISFLSLLIRNSIINSFVYYLMKIIGLFILKNSAYMIYEIILLFIQVLVVIISIFMIKYRSDKRSIADILSHSNVIES